MKIAYYTETYLPNKDGVVTSILTFKKALEDMGHEVYIFAAGDRKAKRENKDPRVFYYTSTPFKPYPMYRIALFPFMSQRDVKKLGIDIVHSHGMVTMGLAAVEAANANKLPLVSTFHTLVPQASHYISNAKVVREIVEKFTWKYLEWYYKKCDAVITPSVVIKEMLEERGLTGISVIPTGIDIRKFNPDNDGSIVRKEWGMEKNKIILNVGRLVLEKNLDVLIKSSLVVLEEFSDARFVIVGEGPAAGYYKKLVNKAGVGKWFRFVNEAVPAEKMPLVYAAADVFAIPSKFETQGIVVQEAMASGKPVVGADYLALKEIIRENYNGYKFDSDDPDECAEKIIKALKSGEEIKKNARKSAEEFSIENCATRLVKLYEKVVL
ncbi:MAG: glycosyltransferase [Candidatus Micrarchaeota archaeon]|nr:glycosyltransferase [Candidatus Micrarchaeota archaeon]